LGCLSRDANLCTDALPGESGAPSSRDRFSKLALAAYLRECSAA
jgi:hypothetical protein